MFMKQFLPLPRILELAFILAVGTNLSPVSAQNVVFTEDWETDHSLDNTYVTNFTASGVHYANLYFDYSTAGVPLSPNSAGSSTRALKMAANLVSGSVFPVGVSVSPVGFGISANFELRFDAWFNFNGPLPGGGSGSTQVGGAGYGTAGTNAQVAGTADSVYIGGTADAGSSADYRVYSPSHQSSYQDGDFQIGSDGIAQTTKGDPNSGYVYAAEDGTRNVVPASTTGYYATNFPGQSPPLAQLTLFPQQTNSTGPANLPGTAYNGSLAFKWHDISLQKVANTITYLIDGVLIATVNVTDAGTLGGTNILFNHYDINAGVSTDPNRTNLIFTLIDNVRVTELTNVVSVSATTPGAAETGPTPGVFTITRSAGGAPVTVNYTMSGSASNGLDYTNVLGGPLSGSVTFAAADLSTNITIVPIDDAIPELTETIKLSINPSAFYFGAGSAIVTIADNENPQLTITNVSTQMYERTNDYAAFTITRLGDTNAASFTANLSFSGTATEGVDFYAVAVTLEPGAQTTNFNVYPIVDSFTEGSETVTATIAAAGAGEYTIGSPSSASITVVDANLPAETVLFQDNFDVDSAANWNLFFAASTNDFTPDYNALFAFNYGDQGIPPAPHGNGSTLGLYLNVNKDSVGSAAALNLYPSGKTFSGNFALRFDMFLSVPQPNSSATEYVLAGINHSGTKTNWWRSGGVPAGSTFDGVFFTLETDNNASPNYANYGPPTTTALNPTLLGSNTAASAAAAFKSPPWVVANTPGNINNPAGVFATPIWADVEISKSGNLITLIINNTKIYTYSNATAFASGNIMVGYEDAFDSISPGQSYAVLDNVRVVTITPPVITAQPVNSTNAVGTPATFTVTATTSTTVTNYQWFSNNAAIANATNASYSLASVATTNYGSYRVEVSDGRYTTVSSTVVLRPPVPVINIQPSSRAAVVGSSPTLSVTATSFSGTTNYQWLYYGTNVAGTGVSGATTRVLTLGNIQAVKFNGPYTVRVNDGTTSITSAPSATITVAVSPTVAAPAAIGADFVFSYPSEVGPSYVVDFKSALTNVAWTPIKTNSGTGSPINITNALSGDQGYFRIRLQ
jgi:hypothetical protein